MAERRINQALIMAAGRGQRMLPLTAVIPKPMAPYKNSTLIANGINNLSKYIEFIHVTVGYKGPILAKHLIDINVNTIFNTTGRGNSWWIYNTLLSQLDEPIFVLTCDNIIELDFNLLSENYFEAGSPACMLVPVQPIPGLEGDYIFHDDFRVTKLDRYTPSPIYCSGIQILNPKKINELIKPSGDFYQIWNQLIEINQLFCSKMYPDKWISVDTIEQLNNLPQ